MIFHTARDLVAPTTEKTAPTSPAAVFLRDENLGKNMVNQSHAKIIDRLRDAAKDHGEVANLLAVIADSFLYFPAGDSKFCGDEQDRAYLLAAIDANSFAAIDRETKGGN